MRILVADEAHMTGTGAGVMDISQTVSCLLLYHIVCYTASYTWPMKCVSSPVSLSHLTIGETVFIDDCIQLYVGSGYPNPEPSTLFVERQSLYPSLSLLDLVFSPGSFFLLNTDYNHPEDSTEE